ncbi:hypothetical protein PRIPAC_85830 [Pristionchus pacificus]|uniref:RRP7 domain-containing protein n=1 Tax=Pristionchus pacificus TaxID=54126 RepID=A0A2A6BMI2_PRIPA|nr:hypothetical protein PRIPAC_85830 [Pristionchus pacificus]|eukprot:PDM67013.1 hypothetical protein PRIPAC_48430 [Pristionchus pacificus]
MKGYFQSMAAEKKIGKKKRLIVKNVKKEDTEVCESTPEVIPLDVHKCLRYSLSSSFTCERHLFLKADASNICALLVGNVPSYLDLDVINGFLSEFVKASIDGVFPLRSNSASNRFDVGQLTIRIVFSSPEGVKEALAKAETSGPFIAEKYGPFDDTTTIQAQMASYHSRVVDSDSLMKEVDEYMNAHDEEAAAANRAARKRRKVADEDGWITVTKGSRTSAPESKKMREDEPLSHQDEKRKQKKVDVAFYNFQIKESKMKHLNELRAKFEEDKKRVAMAKAARKFRPL